MDRNEARWAEIVFWPEEDLRQLHRREMLREEKSKSLISERKMPIENWDIKFIAQMRERLNLVPYWDRMIPESDRQTRMEKFLHKIYPAWKSIIGNESNDFGSMADLHRADWAIFKSDVRPNRGIAS
jgi:hypothetical protein